MDMRMYMLFRKKNLLNENIEYQDNLKNKLNYKIVFMIKNIMC